MTPSDNFSHVKTTGEKPMFKKSKSISDEFSGFLSDETSMTGDLQFSGKMHLNGHFHGSISTTDILIIGEKATVEADIKAGEVQVCGKVYGNIESVRRVEITETGQVHGDIRTPQFVIEVGGVFEGKSSTAASSQESSSSQVTLLKADKSTVQIAQTSSH
jgi:cytoskeletal protein CcmA (bactofilin family)